MFVLLFTQAENLRKTTKVMVMDPVTKTLLTGPNAPTEENLGVWLKAHPSFHVVMPKAQAASKFYG